MSAFSFARMPLIAVLVLSAWGGVLAGCEEPEPEPDYVARLGNSYLTQQELKTALQDRPAARDSAQARQQIIEQWVTRELLHQEARRRGLREKADVQRLLRENERSVLVSALLSSLYEEASIQPTPSEVQAYYERNKSKLKLREPYAQVRHLATSRFEAAANARQQLQQAVIAGEADSVWAHLVTRYAQDAGRALDLSEHYYPEDRLFRSRPSLQRTLKGLSNNQIAPLTRTDSLIHVLQLVERAPAGATPKPAWIEDELKRRLTIEKRKRTYARQVQRLRNEALAREALDVRP